MSVGQSNLRQATVITVLVAAVFMSNLDLWIVNVALVEMGRGFGVPLADLSWVLNGYAVTLAALLIPAGRLGDRIGHRRVFLGGITLFTLASVACALAPNIAVLVLARIAQAAGAAAQLPTSLALLLAAVPATARTEGRPWLVGRRRAVRRGRAGVRRAAGERQLALDLPGQPAGRCADRPRRAARPPPPAGP